MTRAEDNCNGCRLTVRLPEAEVQRLLAQYFRDAGQTMALADAAESQRRLEICARCPHFLYGTTCAICGCLVAIRARIATRSCPSADPRW